MLGCEAWVGCDFDELFGGGFVDDTVCDGGWVPDFPVQLVVFVDEFNDWWDVFVVVVVYEFLEFLFHGCVLGVPEFCGFSWVSG